MDNPFLPGGILVDPETMRRFKQTEHQFFAHCAKIRVTLNRRDE
jgi:hypothetical protein